MGLVIDSLPELPDCRRRHLHPAICRRRPIVTFLPLCNCFVDGARLLTICNWFHSARSVNSEPLAIPGRVLVVVRGHIQYCAGPNDLSQRLS